MSHEEHFEGYEAALERSGPHPMTSLALVAAGGCAGAVARYLLEAAITSRTGTGFPWGTLVVNVSGALVLGLLVALAIDRGIGGDLVRPAIGIGFLGAYTTFSTYAMDAIALAEDGHVARALTYVGITNLAGIVAAATGLVAGRSI